MEADTTAILFFPHYLYPLLSQHSTRLFVNELVIRERSSSSLTDVYSHVGVLRNEDIALPPLTSFTSHSSSAFSCLPSPISLSFCSFPFLTILACYCQQK